MPVLTIGTTISKHMTQSPLRIDATTTISQALEIMTKAKIRHLPVVQKRKLVGVVNLRDLKTEIYYNEIDPNTTVVQGVMNPNPFCASPGDSLAEISVKMAKAKINYVIIVENEDVVGIFTETDALRIINDVCQDTSRYNEEAKKFKWEK